MAVKMYDPSAVSILLAGVLPITGVAEGSFVSVAKDTPYYTTSKSTDGQVYRTFQNDNTFTIKITLASSSESNGWFDKLLKADVITQKGIFPLFIKDMSGSSFFYSTSSWIEAEPNLVFADNVEALEWTIRSSQGLINYGGNDGEASLEEDILNTVISALPVLSGVF